MNSDNSGIQKFETRVRQLILAYTDVKNANADLQTQLTTKDGIIAQLRKQLEESDNRYNALKIARMLEISNSDMDEARQRLTNLIREVNRCINLLKEQ